MILQIVGTIFGLTMNYADVMQNAPIFDHLRIEWIEFKLRIVKFSWDCDYPR